MNKKLILISIDGMRPDGLLHCGSPAVDFLKANGSYCFSAKTVFPSVTLPCHMSLFYGVPPMRHGILSNTFVPQVHSVAGIFEKINAHGGVSAIFYGWEAMRDVASPGTCKYATFIDGYEEESVDTLLTDGAIKLIREKHPDFVYLYQVDTDDKGGHDNGWMTPAYLERLRIAIENAQRMVTLFGAEYTIIITSDHGGHDRMHGTDLPEDMIIPMFFLGSDFEKGKELGQVSILDIAPTIAKVMGFEGAKEWEGKALF